MSKYWYDVLAVEESAPFGFCPCCGKAFDGELIDFYESNGFIQFGKRKKDRDELGIDGDYLIQLLRYMSNGK